MHRQGQRTQGIVRQQGFDSPYEGRSGCRGSVLPQGTRQQDSWSHIRTGGSQHGQAARAGRLRPWLQGHQGGRGNPDTDTRAGQVRLLPQAQEEARTVLPQSRHKADNLTHQVRPQDELQLSQGWLWGCRQSDALGRSVQLQEGHESLL